MSPTVSLDWQLLTAVAALLVLAVAAMKLPWYKLLDDPEAQRVLGITTAVLVVLRAFNTHAVAGAQLHFLGAMVACLMFGARFALWAMAVSSLAALILGHAWLGFGPDFLVTGVIPVLIGYGLSQLAERRLPPNLFVYVLVQAFLGGGLTIAACNLTKAAMVAWMGADNAWAYLVATPLMMFGEGFLCGGAMVLIVVYRPQWCATFDDARYLPPPPPPPPR